MNSKVLDKAIIESELCDTACGIHQELATKLIALYNLEILAPKTDQFTLLNILAEISETAQFVEYVSVRTIHIKQLVKVIRELTGLEDFAK